MIGAGVYYSPPVLICMFFAVILCPTSHKCDLEVLAGIFSRVCFPTTLQGG